MSFLIPHIAGSPHRGQRLVAEIQAADVVGRFDDPFNAIEDQQENGGPDPEPVTVPIPSSYQQTITDRYVKQQMALEGYSVPLPSASLTTANKKRKDASSDLQAPPPSKRAKRAADVLLDDSSCDSHQALAAHTRNRNDLTERLYELNDASRSSNFDDADLIRAKSGKSATGVVKWAENKGIKNISVAFDGGGDDNDDAGQLPKFEKSASHSRDECFFCVYEGKQLPKDIMVEYRIMLEYFEEHITSVPAYKLAEAIYAYYRKFIFSKLEEHVQPRFRQSLCPKMSPEIVYSHIMVCTRDPRVFQATAIDMCKRLAFRLVQNCETMVAADFENRMNGAPAIELDKKMLTLSERWLKMVVFLYKIDPKKCAFYNPLKNRPIHKLGALGLMPTYDLTQEENDNDGEPRGMHD